MTDLSSTVLRGTDQVTDAYKGLANLRAVNRERKTRAMAGIGESLASLGKTLRDYGSWKDAKAAEDETRQVEDAYALGMQTGDPTKALVTLGATKVRHAASATLRSKRINEVMDLSHQRNVDRSDEALTNYRNQQTEDLKRAAADEAQEKIDRAKFLESGGPILPPDALPGEIETVRQWHAKLISNTEARELLKGYAKERERRTAAEKEAAKAKEKEAANKVFDEANRAAMSDDPVLDKLSGAYRPPTFDDRMQRASAVAGVEKGHIETIRSVVKASEDLKVRAKRDNSAIKYREDDLELRQAAYEWKKQMEATGLNVRTVLAQNDDAQRAATALLMGAEKQARATDLQKLYVTMSEDLTDEQKAARLGEIAAADARAKKIIDEFKPMLESIAKTGGKPAPAGPGLGAGQGNAPATDTFRDTLTPEGQKEYDGFSEAGKAEYRKLHGAK